ncbi:zinc finger protein ZFP2-like [Diabrotica virgifera virgifera]|uniref:C2H2-type domain-containing protein n=1 Tax=Diabrotica virgifera virgifera TaxID=50390 RepID=A0ABM5L8V9_DIAVI|nr:zinc finger protein ZFP2-like [Diabrotica virgifera virgifera]
MPSQTQMVTSKTAPRLLKVIPSQTQLLVTSKTAPPALKVYPSPKQLLIKSKTSSPVLKVIPKVRMPSNTVISRSEPPLKVVPLKIIKNHPTKVHPNTQVVTKSKSASPTYINPFNYTPKVKNTLPSICIQKIAVKGEGNLMQVKMLAWACKICTKEFHEKEQLMEHYEMHKNTTDQLGDIDENNDAYNISSKEVTCPVCLRTYAHMDSYRAHVALKHKPKDHNCDTCKRTFPDDFYLSRHNATHNEDPELYECVICKKFQTKNAKNLYEHITKEHVKEEMYCKECDKTFLSKTWFEDHKIFHVEINEIDMYKCSRCKSTFTTNYSLMEHVQEAHIKYKCGQCDVTFPYKQNLDEHNRHLHVTAEELLCNECGKTFTNVKYLRRHEKTHKPEKYVCYICGKILVNKPGFKLHMRVHTGEKPYKCNFCNKAFRQSSVCNTHKKRIHGESPYPGMIRMIEKPYSCSQCKKSFFNTASLMIHMRVHTGEKPYSCSMCKKAFSYASSFKIHMQTHNGERPYPCFECNKSFTDRTGLIKHMRVHSKEKPYSCSICKRAFSQSASLKIHMRVHTKEKPYPCSVCKKAFSQSNTRQVHMTIHTGERAYPCSKCNKKFITKGMKDVHEKKCNNFK